MLVPHSGQVHGSARPRNLSWLRTVTKWKKRALDGAEGAAHSTVFTAEAEVLERTETPSVCCLRQHPQKRSNQAFANEKATTKASKWRVQRCLSLN